MPWTYGQSTGQLTRSDKVVGTGYSGAPAGKNNPQMQAVRDVGPIPQGRYSVGVPRNTQDHGPFVLPLTPIGHNALGRTGFLIHGESKTKPPGQASQGCIIMDPNVRHQIAASGDNDLTVVP